MSIEQFLKCLFGVTAFLFLVAMAFSGIAHDWYKKQEDE